METVMLHILIRIGAVRLGIIILQQCTSLHHVMHAHHVMSLTRKPGFALSPQRLFFHGVQSCEAISSGGSVTSVRKKDAAVMSTGLG